MSGIAAAASAYGPHEKPNTFVLKHDLREGIPALADSELWCESHVNGDDQFFNWYKSTYLGRENPVYRTNAQIFQ